MRQAVACQMGFVGAPMIYYGDEAGMWSPDDPSNRMPMTWPGMKFEDPQVRFDETQFAFYQRAIAARRQLDPLSLGFFHAIEVDDARGVYAYQRDLGEARVYVVVNRSDQERQISFAVSDANGTNLTNWLDEKQATIVGTDGGSERPMLQAKSSGVAVSGGKISITLKPFDTAILSKP